MSQFINVHCPYCKKEHNCEYLWTTETRRLNWQQKMLVNNFRCQETNGVFKFNNIVSYE